MRLTLLACAVLTAILLGACTTPSSLYMTQLVPQAAPGILTLHDVVSRADSATRVKEPPNADRVIVIVADSAFAFFSLYELRDIFWLDIYIYNGRDRPFVMEPRQLTLMDGQRTAFRPLAPHEAANLYSAQMTTIAAYQPKYLYDVNAATTGYLSSSGYYSAQTTGTVTAREDPYYALGYTIGAAIARHRNQQLRHTAALVYTTGFVAGSEIPAKSGGFGGIYWLHRADSPLPIILRFQGIDAEVVFR